MTEPSSELGADDARLFIDDPDRYDEGYIVLPRWEDVQHRDAIRSGYPWKWHKCLTEQLDNPAYRDLVPGARGLLHDLRMAVSRTGQGRLRADRRTLDSIFGYRSRHTLRHRDSLIQAGFLKVSASRWPAQIQQPAGTEERGSSNLLREEENARSAAAMNGRRSRSEDPTRPHLGDTTLATQLAEINRQLGGPA